MAFVSTGLACNIRARRTIKGRVTGSRCSAAPSTAHLPGETSDPSSADVPASLESKQWDLIRQQLHGNWVGHLRWYGAVGGEIEADRPGSTCYANYRVDVINDMTWIGRKVPEEEAASIDDVDPYLELDISVMNFRDSFSVPGVVGQVVGATDDAPTAMEINFISSDGMRRMLIARYEVLEGARQLARVTTAYFHDRDHVRAPVLRTEDALGQVADLLETPPTAACTIEHYDDGGSDFVDSVAEWRGPKARGLRGDSSRCVKVLRDGLFVSIPIFPTPGDVFVFGHCILPSATAQVIEFVLDEEQRFTTIRTYVWGEHPISAPAQKYLLKVK